MPPRYFHSPRPARNWIPQKHVTLSRVTSQGAPLGSVHGTAQRAADILAVLLPRAGNRLSPGSVEERAAVIDVLRAHGEP